MLQTGVFRRFVCRAGKYPWLLVSLADMRIPEAKRLQIAERFLATSPCCMWPGFARKVKAEVNEPEELLSAKWVPRWQALARVWT